MGFSAFVSVALTCDRWFPRLDSGASTSQVSSELRASTSPGRSVRAARARGEARRSGFFGGPVWSFVFLFQLGGVGGTGKGWGREIGFLTGRWGRTELSEAQTEMGFARDGILAHHWLDHAGPCVLNSEFLHMQGSVEELEIDVGPHEFSIPALTS